MCRGRESSSSVANKGKSGNWRQFSPALVNKAGRHLPPFLQRALVGEERFALHEEQRKGRQADIRHAVGHLAVPLVGKGRAGRANACQKGLKHLHAGLNHTSSRSETHPSHQPFRIAGRRRDILCPRENPKTSHLRKAAVTGIDSPAAFRVLTRTEYRWAADPSGAWHGRPASAW